MLTSPTSMVHGRYTVVRKLAEGGMAEIFLARQHGSEGFEKPVVLKRIHTAFYADEQFRNMLVDEAHISMGLHHNNIVQVLDLGRAGGRMFLALELVNGWDLSRLLQRASAARKPLPVGLGLYIIAEVARALSYAHSRTRDNGEPMGIVHRDVSPQNVLLSEQGEVKLTDFGIAKALTNRDRTATGVVKGKIAFMSPEQAHGQPLDQRSDLFSLGTMLYLLSTGVRPFEAPTDFEVIARVQKGYFVQPEEVKPDLSPALANVIKRAMSVDREQRYQTADELLVDLEGILRNEYASAGQTELKLWLAELGRIDGVPPISRAAAFAGTGRDGTGDLAEGDALVLGESTGEDEAHDGDGPSSLGSVDGLEAVDDMNRYERRTAATRNLKVSGQRRRSTVPAAQRMTGMEPTTVSDLSLAVDDGDEMVERLRSRGRRRMFGAGMVAVLLVAAAGGFFVWRASSVGNAQVPEGDGEGKVLVPVAADAAAPPRVEERAKDDAPERREPDRRKTPPPRERKSEGKHEGKGQVTPPPIPLPQIPIPSTVPPSQEPPKVESPPPAEPPPAPPSEPPKTEPPPPPADPAPAAEPAPAPN